MQQSQVALHKPNASIDLKGVTPISDAWRASLIQVIWEENKSILNLSSPNILLSDKIFSFLSLSFYDSTPIQEYSEVLHS